MGALTIDNVTDDLRARDTGCVEDAGRKQFSMRARFQHSSPRTASIRRWSRHFPASIAGNFLHPNDNTHVVDLTFALEQKTLIQLSSGSWRFRKSSTTCFSCRFQFWRSCFALSSSTSYWFCCYASLGKRELAQLNPFDLVVLLSLSNTVQNAIIGDDNSVTGGHHWRVQPAGNQLAGGTCAFPLAPAHAHP